MKRILCMMLAVMLLVGSLSTVASAADAKTAKYTFTVTGNNVGTYEFQIKADDPLKITKIEAPDALMVNPKNGKVAYLGNGRSNIENLNVKVTVHVELPADTKCGTYEVSIAYTKAYEITMIDEYTAGPLKEAKIKVTGGDAITVDHKYPDEWQIEKESTSCQDAGLKYRLCTACSHRQEKEFFADHEWSDKWSYNSKGHFHKCTTEGCDATSKTKDHDNVKKYDKNGHWNHCEVCGRDGKSYEHTLQWKYNSTHHWKACKYCKYTTEKVAHKYVDNKCECGHKLNPNKDEVVDMGDITPYGTYNTMVFVAVAIVMLSVVALVNKRKTAK